MSEELTSIYYRSRQDKIYGLAGMIAILYYLDAIGIISKIDLDADGPMITFTDDFHHYSSPAYSPKEVWLNDRKYFYITSAIIVANLMSRATVLDGRDVPDEILHSILAEIIAEGRDSCSLEADEVEQIFEKIMHQNILLFHDTRYRPTINAIVKAITQNPQMSAADLSSFIR